jgi:hypothetical protein
VVDDTFGTFRFRPINFNAKSVMITTNFTFDTVKYIPAPSVDVGSCVLDKAEVDAFTGTAIEAELIGLKFTEFIFLDPRRLFFTKIQRHVDPTFIFQYPESVVARRSVEIPAYNNRIITAIVLEGSDHVEDAFDLEAAGGVGVAEDEVDVAD